MGCAPTTPRECLRKNLEHWDRYGFGVWILRSKVDGTLAGRSALRRADVDGRVVEKLGGSREGDIVHAGLPHVNLSFRLGNRLQRTMIINAEVAARTWARAA